MDVAGRDGVGGLNDFPFFRGIGHGALNNFPVEAFETAESPRRAERVETMSARPSGKSGVGCGGAGRDKRRFLVDRAVAIDAINFDGGSRFAVNFPVAVIVLIEMAIGALHSLFKMDVGEVHRFAETFGIIERNNLVVFVEPVPFSIVLVDAAEDPAVAVEICELRGF